MNETSSGPQFCSTLTGMDGNQTLLYSAVFGDPRYSAEKVSEDQAPATSRTHRDGATAGQDAAALIDRTDTLERSGMLRYGETGELSPLLTERDGLVQIIGDDNGAHMKTVCNINTIDSSVEYKDRASKLAPSNATPASTSRGPRKSLRINTGRKAGNAPSIFDATPKMNKIKTSKKGPQSPKEESKRATTAKIAKPSASKKKGPRKASSKKAPSDPK
jgi:hypothetical protein